MDANIDQSTYILPIDVLKGWLWVLKKRELYRTKRQKQISYSCIFNQFHDIPLLNSDTYTNIHTPNPNPNCYPTNTHLPDPNSHIDPNSKTYLDPNPHLDQYPHLNQTNNNDNALVILATKTKLSELQKQVLRKGLTFIPKPRH